MGMYVGTKELTAYCGDYHPAEVYGPAEKPAIWWNQLMNRSKISVAAYYDYSLDNDIYELTADSVGNRLQNTIQCEDGHIYFMFAVVRNGGENSVSFVPYSFGKPVKVISSKTNTTGEWNRIYYMLRAEYSGSLLAQFMISTKEEYPQTAFYKKGTFNVFDLTAMFGEGYEPAIAQEFELLFPEDSYPLNKGEWQIAPAGVSTGLTHVFTTKMAGWKHECFSGDVVWGNNTYNDTIDSLEVVGSTRQEQREEISRTFKKITTCKVDTVQDDEGRIQSVVDSVLVCGVSQQDTFSGKNLFSGFHADHHSGNIQYTDTAVIYQGGTDQDTFWRIGLAKALSAGATISVSFKVQGATNPRGELRFARNHYKGTGLKVMPFHGDGTYSFTVTIPEGDDLNALDQDDNSHIYSDTDVTFYDWQMELGEESTNYEPFVGGLSAPNPWFPQDVRGLNGNILAEGENWCPDVSEWKLYNGAYLADESIVLPDINSCASVTIPWYQKDRRIFVGCIPHSDEELKYVHLQVSYWDENLIQLSGNGYAGSFVNDTFVITSFGGMSIYGDALQKAAYVKFNITRSTGYAKVPYRFKTPYFSPYSLDQYQKGQFPVQRVLPELRALPDGTCDKFHFSWKQHRAWVERWVKETVLKGTERWELPTGIHSGYSEYRVTTFFDNIPSSALCTHFPTVLNTDYNRIKQNALTSYPNTRQMIILVSSEVADSERQTTTEAWKEWLAAQYEAGTPVKVYSPYAEAVVEELPFDDYDFQPYFPKTQLSLRTDLPGTMDAVITTHGIPSLERSSEMVSLQGKVCSEGVNILSPGIFSVSGAAGGIYHTNNGDGSYTLNGTATMLSAFGVTTASRHHVLEAGQYRLTGGHSPQTYIQLKDVERDTNIVEDKGQHPTFSLSKPTKVRFNIRCTEGTMCENLVVKPMIERGSVPHPFIPYREPSSIQLPILRSLPHGVRDSIIVDTLLKRAWVERKVKEVVLNTTLASSRSIREVRENTVYFWFNFVGSIQMKPVTDKTKVKIRCNKLKCYPTEYIRFNDVEGINDNSNAVSNFLQIAVNKRRLSSFDADGIKEWLNSAEIAVMFELAEPEIEEIPYSESVLSSYPLRTHLHFVDIDEGIAPQMEVKMKVADRCEDV